MPSRIRIAPAARLAAERSVDAARISLTGLLDRLVVVEAECTVLAATATRREAAEAADDAAGFLVLAGARLEDAIARLDALTDAALERELEEATDAARAQAALESVS